jgi:hypothetical protein
MDDNHEHPSLDGLLDEALKEYSNAEPRSGLGNRIMSNLRIEQDRQSRMRRWWTLGSALAMVGVAGAIWAGFSRYPSSTSTATSNVPLTERLATPASPNRERTPAMHVAARKSHGPAAARRVVAKSERSVRPRLSAFPSSRPLSEQEKLLLAYIRVAPTPEILAAVAQASDSSDLQIRDLEIPALGND